MSISQPTESLIVAALRRAAPTARADELERYARAISVVASLNKAASPAMSRRGTQPALKSLRLIQHAVMSLAHKIEAMGADEQLALRAVSADLQQLDMLRALQALNEAIIAAHRHLADAPPVAARGRGRPGKAAADKIAAYVARVFTQLTAQPAKRGRDRTPDPIPNRFVMLLRELTPVLGISLGERQARNVSKPAQARSRR